MESDLIRTMSRWLAYLTLGASFAAGVAACSGRGTVIASRSGHPGGGDSTDSGARDSGAGHSGAVDSAGFGGTAGATDAGTSSTGAGGAGVDSGISEGGTTTDVGLLIPKSGSRIEVTGVVAGDQILGMGGVVDKQHATSCAVQQAADGIPRCLPQGGDIVFADAACTKPLFHVQGGSTCPPEVPAYAVYASGSLCPSIKLNVVQVGPLYSDPSVQTNYAYDSDTGSCTVPIHGFDSYYATAPSPASDWVAFERKLVQVSDELGVEVWQGQDGSRIPGSFRLLPSDVACEPLGPLGSPSAMLPNHCIPRDRAYDIGVFYADSACTNVVSVAQSLTCDRPTITQAIPDPSTCTAGHYFQIDRQVSLDSLYSDMGQTPDQTSCHPLTLPSVPPGTRGYVRGPEIDVGRYPAMQLVAEGTGRIQPLYWESNGRKFQLAGAGDAFDLQLGTSCSPTKFADRKTRCVPPMGSLDAPIYGDAACTVPLYAPLTPPAPCSTPPPAWVAQPSNASVCGASSIGPVRSVTGAHHGKVYGQVTPTGTCTPVDPSTDPTQLSSVVYDVGDAVDPSKVFAEVTETDL